MTTQEVPAQQLGDVVTVPQPPARSARRRNWRPYIGLGICIAVAVGGIIILVTVVVPYASAAGGCGGG